MSHLGKVVWAEGMFLRAQHFQQQERHVEFMIHRRTLPLCGHYWGFRTLELDEGALALGIVAIRRADGVLPDGTVFSFPDHGAAPAELQFPADLRATRICLALPRAQPGVTAIEFAERADSGARYGVVTTEVEDCNSMGGAPADVQLGQLRLRLLPDVSVPDGWVRMGVVRVLERAANNALVLDREYIPPTLDTKRQEGLAALLRELSGLLAQRGQALSARLTSTGRGAVSELSEFLLLQTVNEWQPLVVHLARLDGVHPERLYAALLPLAGVLSSYSTPDRRPPEFPEYDHDNLQQTFAPLVASLRQSLSMVLERAAVRIDLSEHSYGVHVGQVADPALFATAGFVLAVHAELPAEQLRVVLPAQLKIGPVEKIRDLVNLHLPGIGVRPLPAVPRELPYRAGHQYFELESGHEFWRELERGGRFALHVSGALPGLELECWAIRKHQ